MPPFSVLHVCMGNICRSPMAERLLVRAVRERLAQVPTEVRAEELVHSHSAGTGGWHVGEGMDPQAARQVRARGGDPTGFVARKLRPEHIDATDLVLTATGEQWEYVLEMRPDAADRTFVLGQFGRLLAKVDAAALPPADLTPEGVYRRGVAVVAQVNAARGGSDPLPGDDLDDPWGRGDRVFSRVADEIEETLVPLATLLLP
ncbi:MAG TPA: phosphotyrosine protein phosphatase [Micromonospora sp.]